MAELLQVELPALSQITGSSRTLTSPPVSVTKRPRQSDDATAAALRGNSSGGLMSPSTSASSTQLFEALPTSIEDALRASIQRFGVLVPVVKDQHGRILDGHHRSRLAAELDIDYRVDVRLVASDEEAREIARTLNADRRHLTDTQRHEVALALRREGHSYRAIAGALGVSKNTVQRDVDGPTVPRGTVEFPERIIGLDGKTRPARRTVVVARNQREAEVAQQLLTSLNGNVPEGTLSLRDIRQQARRSQPPPRRLPEQERRSRQIPLLRFCPPEWTSAQIVAAILRVCFPDAKDALDVTWGSGCFWDGSAHVSVRRTRPGTDFRALRHRDSSRDIVVYDPPHLADAGDESLMRHRFGTYGSRHLEGVICAGAAEAFRVARLGVVVKVCDYVHGQRLIRETGWVIDELGEPYEIVHETRTHAVVDPRWREQLSAWNNSASYLVFRKDGPLHVRRTADGA
jgi:ParB-like chromosome segregation protein Spo0J